MTGLCKLITRFARDERATATMEFVIMFPVVITLFIAVFENGVILTRQVLLERSLDEAVRLLRLARTITDAETGQPRALTAADISEAICDNTGAIPDCDTVLVVDLRVIDTTTYALPAADVSCIDRRDLTIQPANEFRQGQNNDLVVIRVCAIVDRLLPFSGFGLNLVRDDTGGLHIVASSVFVNEPQ
ncbi:MAG: TadE/TadG family type IV pilus assembly protein [Roseicyclus sp.]|jgi:Flp pilus assembly protein TadG|uniref:TadE/TadG family type IV pilus assembly protein n=1 Tax=Roseicyclus sp. TaxID=1914329 RepID=UPI003A835F8C